MAGERPYRFEHLAHLRRDGNGEVTIAVVLVLLQELHSCCWNCPYVAIDLVPPHATNHAGTGCGQRAQAVCPDRERVGKDMLHRKSQPPDLDDVEEGGPPSLQFGRSKSARRT